MSSSSADPVVEMVVDELRARSVVGQKKYGHKMDREDLDAHDWCQHALEEAMDLCLYLRRLKMELEVMKPK